MPIPLHPFNITDIHNYTDLEAERGLLAAMAQNPSMFRELEDTLPIGVFTDSDTIAARVAMSSAIAEHRPADLPEAWTPAEDPRETAARLVDQFHRRHLAGIAARAVEGLRHEDRPAAETLTQVEEAVRCASQALQATEGGAVRWCNDVLTVVLNDLWKRLEQRKQTGNPYMGLLSGLRSLDNILGGFEGKRLYLLAGGPGVGKTTAALQIAAHVARDACAVFVTFENSPEELTLKQIAAHACIDSKLLMRGLVDDTGKILRAAGEWQKVSGRIAFIDGTSKLTVAQVRARAFEVMARCGVKKCLVVADYLQAWAKGSEELRKASQDIRGRVEILGAGLRELAVTLDCPVLALCSQNRAGAGDDYKADPKLESLKESGDLEYGADAVMFLTPAKDKREAPPAKALQLSVKKHRHGETGDVQLVMRYDIGTVAERA